MIRRPMQQTVSETLVLYLVNETYLSLVVIRISEKKYQKNNFSVEKKKYLHVERITGVAV